MSERRPSTPTESELVELLHSIDVPAPEWLHREVRTMIEQASAGADAKRTERRLDAPRRSYSLGPRLAAGGAILAALIALAIAVGLSGGSSKLSVRDAAALTLRSATRSAPAESDGDRAELTASVDGISFPYWGGHFGWRSTGSRSDSVDGRTVQTVFYGDGRGRRVGYAIVAGSAPEQISGGVVSRRDGTSYRLLSYDGASVVAWQRDGHLCVVSGHGVSGATLLRLASWDDSRAVNS